jgi:acetyl-CoA carboxylase biotin carboxylase subunit
MGTTSAAVYSEADRTSLHVRLADEAHLIGKAVSSDSYLNAEKIISLAKKIHADAIHPGYGFFSENAKFIAEVEKAGLIFIGPSSTSVELMGSKTAARQLMQTHGVPIVPGTTESITSIDSGLKAAEKIGFPILLKAAAGGGGKGMRKVLHPKDFKDAFEATQREALKSFANDSIYIEKLIENPRHIEVQIIADKHGNYAHLFERECSIQRRHQKIIEEAPSSFVDECTRLNITNAAVNAAKACNYTNAGTVEFLMDSNKNFYFLEMNTRLQVEHPVTEFITGIDLVKEQISIANGHRLSFKQDALKVSGHSFECRVYAEDPSNEFLPSTGRIYEYIEPSGPGIRVDSGFNRGSVIDVYYDPLISKLVCWGADRNQAIRRMIRALNEYHIAGVTTNLSFLIQIFRNKDFTDGNFDINFLEQKFNYFDALQLNEAREKSSDAAAVFAALIKTLRISNGTIQNEELTTNNWSNQLYE